MIENLRREVLQKERKLIELEEQCANPPPPATLSEHVVFKCNEAPSMSTKDLQKRIPKSSIQTPLEALLGNDVSANHDGLSGDHEQCQHVHWQPVSLDTVINAAKSARNQH